MIGQIRTSRLTSTLWVSLLAWQLTFVTVAHPIDTNDHPHTTSSIVYELDGIEDGTSPHNHFNNDTYGTGGDLESPYDVSFCWDKTSRITHMGSPTLPFNAAHCWVNPSIIFLNQRPTYAFAANWPSEFDAAKAPIREAFDKWSSVTSPFVYVGAVITEGPAITANILISMADSVPGDPLSPAGLSMLGNFGDLVFNDNVNWGFDINASAIADDEHHMFSVALHEVGHAFGFDETINSDSIMWNTSTSPPIGYPRESGSTRFFSGLMSDDKVGVKAVYGKSIGLPSPPTDVLLFCDGCDGYIGHYTGTFDSTNLIPGDYFEAERRIGNAWQPWYEGGSVCLPTSSQGDVDIRVRIENIIGYSIWIYRWAYCDCGGSGGGL